MIAKERIIKRIKFVLYQNKMLNPPSHDVFYPISAIPFSLIIFRLLFLANTNTITLDPSDFIYKDKMVQALFLLYFVILFSILAL